MAWPPPVLATNRTNATPQLDTHAADHNALALGLNDTVARLQGVDTHVKNLGGAGRLQTYPDNNPAPGSWRTWDVQIGQFLPGSPMANCVALVTCSCYYGFAASDGSATLGMYTNGATSPVGGGWFVNAANNIPCAAGTWYSAAAMTLMVPMWSIGDKPDPRIRLAYTNSNIYMAALVGVVYLPGPWPGSPA